MIKLNLGAGEKKKWGYINVDINSALEPDMIADLNNIPWPWEADSIDEVYMEHSLEHLKDLKGTLREIYRIMKNDGKLTLYLPHFTRGLSHPFHYYHFGYGFLNQVRDEVPSFKFEVAEKLRFNYSRMPHWFVQLIGIPINFFANLHLGFCERCWCYCVGGFEEMRVVLRIRK